MAAGLLKQNQGNKILRQNQGGKILKANYDFGKAYYTTSNIKINIPNLNIDVSNLAHTWAMRVYNWDTQINLLRINYSSGLEYNVNNAGGSYHLGHGFYYSSTWIRDRYLQTNVADKLTPIFFGEIGLASANLRVNNQVGEDNSVFSYDKSNYPANIIDNIDIYYSRRIDTTVFGYGNRKIKDFLLFKRTLSQLERDYMYNKSLGNEPYSFNNLLIWLKMNQAEILDFSAAQDGSDVRVGVRNHGSIVNGHGEIIGLPAGTLEEKVAWANANLFVNFL